MRTITAKFAGKCCECGRAFEKGATVVYTGACWHPDCFEVANAAQAAEDVAQAARCAQHAADYKAERLVQVTADDKELFVTWAPNAKAARAAADAFVCSVRAAGGRAKLVGHTKNGKHYVGREVVSYYGLSTLGHHEGWKFRYVVQNLDGTVGVKS